MKKLTFTLIVSLISGQIFAQTTGCCPNFYTSVSNNPFACISGNGTIDGKAISSLTPGGSSAFGTIIITVSKNGVSPGTYPNNAPELSLLMLKLMALNGLAIKAKWSECFLLQYLFLQLQIM
ncbi:MAG: hypothetical protein LCH67_14100 [Bacteroidetes bacterium]|nr:hypothetical protein [Bacteroidota bacterium]